MAKIMIGQDGGSYTFNKVAKTITLSLPSGQLPTLEGLLVITDVTNNTIIYNFADPTKGGTISGNILTLDYDTNTVSFDNADKLQIWYYDTVSQQVDIDEISLVLKQLLQTNKQNYNGMGQARTVIEDGRVTVANSWLVTYMDKIGNTRGEDLGDRLLAMLWQDKVRSKIS